MTHRPKYPAYRMVASGSRDDDEEEEVYNAPVVLTPTLHPYNKDEKIKEANLKLKKESVFDAPSKSTKVRFKEIVAYDDEEYSGFDEEEEDEFKKKDRRDHSRISKPYSKILLVTVPTGYSNDSEEIITDDDDYENDIDLVNDAFRHGAGEKPKKLPSANSEEELDEITPPLTEDTLSSSIETVICRSETEESDLPEVFSKTVNLSNQEEHSNYLKSDNEDSLDSFDFLSLFKEEVNPVVEDISEIGEGEILRNKTDFRKARPSTAISVKVMKKSPIANTETRFIIDNKSKMRSDKNQMTEVRPSTAPAKRMCCKTGPTIKLPSYNGLRSEYGMSAEQLKERERKKLEISSTLRLEKEKKYLEQKIKRKENELTFNNWLIKKKREAEARALRRLRQSNYCFRTTPAPTAHLDKIGILRRKILKRENTCFLLNEIFRSAKPHEQKTYRIYLGLRTH